ncbi:(2,3-dihydroxybenzoyl)adenylate synthase [Pseudonocardia sp. TRM90224]|uniref:(2,3-dihydroxybenzoyl)adenylate synthase n=1 Tax=Pseudonocardia sp. TRM90224 TaxID=2812678 RepID=UPI001E4AB817|nr:AMP-binding protein [Pseudonocardia sp. TRM90224]
MLDGCTPWPAEFAARYADAGLWNGVDLGGLPRTWADRYGDDIALVHGPTRLTFTELADRIDRTAAGFAARGIGAGERVVLQLPNVPEFVVAAFALFRTGAKPVFSLASHRANEIRHLLAVSGASAFVTAREHRGFDHVALAEQMLAEAPELRQVFVLGAETGVADPRITPLAEVCADPVPLLPNDPSDVAFFLLSGGTTALPKLIPRTHDDYAYQTRTTSQVCEIDAADVYLAVLPVEFNFTWGCPGVIGMLGAGATVVLADDPDPQRCFELIEHEGVTFTSLVPTVAHLWLEAREWLGNDLSSLATVQIGGAKLQPELAARIGPELGARLQQVFGMAEGLLSMTRADDDDETVVHTQGRPISPHDEVRIVDEHGVDVGPGAVGELLTRGPYTLRGYYRAAEHNARAFTADGFYRSGDLASRTGTGRLVIEGRIKDVVIRGGDKISAVEVESHLVAHPRIAAAAVVPVPDEFLGERTFAFLVADGLRTTLHELKRALRERGLADYKLPDRVEYVEAFPLTPLGKVDKKVLAAAARHPDALRDWAHAELRKAS